MSLRGTKAEPLTRSLTDPGNFLSIETALVWHGNKRSPSLNETVCDYCGGCQEKVAEEVQIYGGIRQDYLIYGKGTGPGTC